MTWLIGDVGFLFGLALAVFWVFQFVRLMSLDDEELEHPNARFCWVAAFVVLPVLGPFAFILRGRFGKKDPGEPEPPRRRRRAS